MIYKRGKTYTSYIWQDGVRHTRALHTGNKRTAEQLDQQFKEELRQREFQLPQFNPSMAVAELYARFLAEGDPKPYHTDRAKFLLGFFGEMQVGRITRNDVIRYRRMRHQEFVARQTKPGRKLTETTVNRDIEALRRIFFWAVDEGILQHNPLARAPMVRERRTRKRILSFGDEQLFLAQAAIHLGRITVAALDTGMRRGEIFAQLWEHIDFQRGVLSVTHSKTAEGEHREIPLTRRLQALLERDRQPSGLVFTYGGAPLHRIKTAWAATIRRAGISYLRFHDLRHTFNSRLVEVEVIEDVRKELMGHSHGGDVHSLYTHVEMPALRTAIRRLDAWQEVQIAELAAINDAPVEQQESQPATQP